MKSIIISIKPKYVKEILNGNKTLEIRKSFPKCELPCEVYIYCTKGKKDELLARAEIDGVFNYKTQTSNHNIKETRYFFGKDIPSQATEYIKNKYKGRYTNFLIMRSNGCNGLVVAKFTLNKTCLLTEEKSGYVAWCGMPCFDLTKEACVSQDDLRGYLKGKDGYAWHIDNLVIFDKPKELKDFGVKRSPQSYCFCEVDE